MAYGKEIIVDLHNCNIGIYRSGYEGEGSKKGVSQIG